MIMQNRQLIGIVDTNSQPAAQIRGISVASTDTAIPTVSFSASKASGVGTVALAASDLAFQFVNYTTPLVNILGNGNVGIGTTGPSYLLTVGKLNSSGLGIMNSPNGTAAVDAIIFANESYPTTYNNSI